MSTHVDSWHSRDAFRRARHGPPLLLEQQPDGASQGVRKRTSRHKPRILMCAPEHFEVSYVINPWMQGNAGATLPVVAHVQWVLLRDVLARHARVETVEPIAGLPDMPFTANAGLVRGNVFVPSRFRHGERFGEEAHFARWFREHDFEFRELPPSVAFEGAGDALFDANLDVLWMGHGHRTDAAVAPALASLLDVETLPLHLVDPRFYHLDTCFCPLPRGVLLWYPPAFDEPSRALVESRVPADLRIAVDERDALAFACNAVSLGSAVVLHRASGRLKQALDDADFTVIETPLDEFLKAGGSAKCLTLRLDG